LLPWQQDTVVVELDWLHLIAIPPNSQLNSKILEICPINAELQPILAQILLPCMQQELIKNK